MTARSFKACKALRQGSQLLALASSMVGGGALCAPIATGVEQLLWPAIVIAAPFVVVHELLFGSDQGAAAAAEREANSILGAYQDQIRVDGLYTGSLNLRNALYGMLVESRLPFVEIDVAGSVWLLSLAKESHALIGKAETHKYIRLSLGKQGDPDCHGWQSTLDAWTDQPPVRPGTCMLAVFDDKLRSNLQLGVDASRVSSRKLLWVMSDRLTGKNLFSVPFWQSQSKGEPLRVTPTYRAAHEDYTFIRVLRKLSPSLAAGPDGRPYVMQRLEKLRGPGEFNVPTITVQGELRTPVLPAQPQQKENESWSEGYERAYASGKPAIINNRLLVLPAEGKVGPACANPAGSNCDFAKNSAADFGVLTLNYVSAYEAANAGTSPGLHSYAMFVTVAGRRYGGELLWSLRITPATLPAPVETCANHRLACYFYPKYATTTDRELVIRGVFGARDASTAHQLPRDEYELAIPLAQLPVTTGSP